MNKIFIKINIPYALSTTDSTTKYMVFYKNDSDKKEDEEKRFNK